MSLEANRRQILTAGAATLIAATAASQLGAAETISANGASVAKPGPIAFDPWSKLRAISHRKKQLWPVIYVDPKNTTETAERDVETAFDAGADAVVLEIGKAANIPVLAKAIEHIRHKFPNAKVGANYLGDEDGGTDLYGYKTSFKLAKEYGLHIVWVDFSGVDKIKELPEISMQAIEAERDPKTFYVSGVHMKYGTLLDPNKPIEQSALQAMGWVEGLIITGPKTGVPTDPDRARRVRQVIGTYPMGCASGVSTENFPSIAPYVDYCLVNTSISDENHRLIKAKVKDLRKVMS